jgi:hypothetical protein
MFHSNNGKTNTNPRHIDFQFSSARKEENIKEENITEEDISVISMGLFSTVLKASRSSFFQNHVLRQCKHGWDKASTYMLDIEFL